MPDLERIKNNVSKMASMKAPEEDIDGYIKSEGVTVNDVRNFKKDIGISNQDIAEHPFKSVAKTLMQPAAQSLTGKTMEDRVKESINDPNFMQSKTAPFDKFIPQAGNAAMNRMVGGQILDQASTPINYVGGKTIEPIMKMLGVPLKSIANLTKFSKSENRINLAKEARDAVFKSKDDLMSTFGGEYERIIGSSDKSISLLDPVSNLMEDSKGLLENKEFLQDLKLDNPQSKKILGLVEEFGKEGSPKTMLAKDANELSKYIKTIPSIKTKLEKPSMLRDFTNDERILLNLSNDLKESVINEHPDLQSLNEHYAETINDIKSIRGNLKPNQTIGKMKNYSSWDDELKKSFERQVPEKVVSKIKDFEQSDKTAAILKKLGIEASKGAAVLAGGEGAYEVGKRIMGR